MKEIDHITYKVADILGKRNDVPFIMSARETLMEVRATFLRRDFDKNLTYRESSLQDLGIVKLEKVKHDEFPVLQRVCKLKRTVDKIPLPIETKHHNHFAYVGVVDGAPAFQYSNEFAIENYQYSLFPRLYPDFFYKNGYIYVADYDGMNIRVRTMFKDPREADKFKVNVGANCSIESVAYIPEDMVTAIEQEMLRHYGVEKPEEVKVNNDQTEL